MLFHFCVKKCAFLGVALLSHPYDATKESLADKVAARQKKVEEVKATARELEDVKAGRRPATNSSSATSPTAATRRTDAPAGARGAARPPPTANGIASTQTRLNQLIKELEEEDQQLVRLGDASVAAPFTSKFTSIQSSRIYCGIKSRA